MLIVVVAGETSGDILGAGLIQSLKKRYPDARFVGIAGSRMQQVGCESLFPMETLSVMGIVEVLKHLGAILKVRKGLIQFCLKERPDIYIGIDAPDFNLGVEKKLKAAGIKTVHYVSPSVWAWREGRVHTVKKATHLVLCLLPFEVRFYARYLVKARFVGHPLADSIPIENSMRAARNSLKLSQGLPYLAILPGSRKQEINYLLGPFLEAAKLLKAELPDLQFVLPLAHQRLLPLVKPHQTVLEALNVTVIEGRSQWAMQASNAVLLASGTVTLEAMLLKKPMVVAYKFSPLTHWLAKRLVKLKYFSLPNLLAKEPMVTELLQEQVTGENIKGALLPLFNKAQSDAMLKSFSEIHVNLRQGASEKAATAIKELLDGHADEAI